MAAGTPGYAVRLVNALTWYWFLRGRLTEARRSLHTAPAADGEPGEDGAAGEVARLAARAWLTGIELRGSSAEAAPGLAADVDPASGVVDPVMRGRLRCFVGTGLFGHGRHREGLGPLTAGLAAARGSGDRWAEAAALVETGAAHPCRGPRTGGTGGGVVP
ncbi:hypothetical protein ACIBSR_34345 [Streptomyces sp. NPDC049936]|uniref:hypothetical protein n=1 Tax=Streptomyces sp. NPDC049936 TaxID=3365599 RepID=UPI00379C3C62